MKMLVLALANHIVCILIIITETPSYLFFLCLVQSWGSSFIALRSISSPLAHIAPVAVSVNCLCMYCWVYGDRLEITWSLVLAIVVWVRMCIEMVFVETFVARNSQDARHQSDTDVVIHVVEGVIVHHPDKSTSTGIAA